MKDQARYICKKVELDILVNVDTIKQELEANELNDNNNLEEET